jgi:hypothetical protein
VTVATINEDTITIFLARMSLDVTEQDKYIDKEATYLAGVAAMSKAKKDILTSRDPLAIQNAALAEQGAISCVLSVPNVINYSPTPSAGNELARDLRRIIRTELKTEPKKGP